MREDKRWHIDNRTAVAQSFIVLRPISYFLFCFTHVITALTITKDQIAGLGKSSTDLGNNAYLDCLLSYDYLVCGLNKQ
ncbi:hypothetical protein KW437_07605 [Vibrio fluvialis]|nr:hypothetical protein [Vibrio fluvialis]MBY8289395.1 hypothetical protein [Vibrio fluvialis]